MAAAHNLLEHSDIRGRVITLDALHTRRRTANLITECAEYVFTVKGNASETFHIFDSMDWERDGTGRFAENHEKALGRLEARSVRAMAPLEGAINHPGVT